jgi:hypothetical protein
MEAGHPFIDCSKVQDMKQPVPISSQPKPSMLRRSLQWAKACLPIFLTSSIPCSEATPELSNACCPTVVMAESLRKLRLVRPLQLRNDRSLISMTPPATVTWVTPVSSAPHSPFHPVYTTAFDISEVQGGRGAEGVDAVEGEASRGTQRWVALAR